LTLGVMHRVSSLASELVEPVKRINSKGVAAYYHPGDKSRKPYVMTVPLLEILAEVNQVGSGSKKVAEEYAKLIARLGGEFEILLNVDISDIERLGGQRLAEAIEKVRKGDIKVKPGYDGVFGVIKIWSDDGGERGIDSGKQMGLF